MSPHYAEKRFLVKKTANAGIHYLVINLGIVLKNSAGYPSSSRRTTQGNG